MVQTSGERGPNLGPDAVNGALLPCALVAVRYCHRHTAADVSNKVQAWEVQVHSWQWA